MLLPKIMLTPSVIDLLVAIIVHIVTITPAVIEVDNTSVNSVGEF